jgi:hypothetical protein
MSPTASDSLLGPPHPRQIIAQRTPSIEEKVKGKKGVSTAHSAQQGEKEEGLKSHAKPGWRAMKEWRWVYFHLLVLSDWLAFLRFAAGYLALFPNQ